MYKFIVNAGSCGNPYDVGACEKQANQMAQQGYELIQVYQSSSKACGGAKSVLVMVFKKV